MNHRRSLSLVLFASALMPHCTTGEEEPTEEEVADVDSGGVVIAARDVVFEDIIPGVVAFGTVTGDREQGAHGTFVRIPAGQATPLHTHGAHYDAVVVQGNFENPIPGDATSDVVLGAGSYYTVPAEAEHITRCAADSPVDCVSFFYQDVAFDFAPTESPADDPPTESGAVFTAAPQVEFDDIIPEVVAFGTVMGDRETGAHGTFVRIPAGQATPLHTHGAGYKAVIIAGNFENPVPGDSEFDTVLTAGSYYEVPADVEHVTRCAADSPVDCMSFFYQDVAFDFAPVE